jgi:hypothetical protein
MDKVKRLIERGYFPSQLPPAFSTAAFAKHYRALEPQWAISRIARPNTRGEFFSVARVGHSRRPIVIPNPVPQLFLSRAIADYWPQLQAHFTKSKLSLSRPLLRGNNSRATEIISLSELADRRLILSAASRFVVKTDISRFFPTIYTHSIPWALHGKVSAKANQRNRTPAFFGNILDQFVALTQERQTIGIPIGPDTSHVVSEIVATAVDLEIKSELKRWPRGYRHVDDFFLCFDTEAEARHALSAITKALREFELDINVTKTRILSVEDLREDDWTDEIKGIDIRDSASQGRDLQRLFSKAFELARKDENVIKYALKKSIGVRVHPENWELYEANVLRSGIVSPNCLSTVASILSTYNALGYSLHRDRVLSFCKNIIAPAARSEHHSEVVWGLWTALELSIKLPKTVTAALGGIRSAVSALVALHLRDESLLTGTLDTSSWQSFLNPIGLKGPMWMLAYEASRKGWLGGGTGFVAMDPLFGPLHAADVPFYETRERLAPFIRKITKTRFDPDMGDIEEEDYELDETLDEYAA